MKSFIALMLISSSVFARELVCNLNEGANRQVLRTEIVESGVTQLQFTNSARNNTITARAQYETVTLTIDAEGTVFRTNSNGEAQFSFQTLGQESLSVSCRITRDPIYCAPASN